MSDTLFAALALMLVLEGMLPLSRRRFGVIPFAV